MTREQLEHLIRAAGDIANDDELIIIGSQAILGEHPGSPPSLLVSMEADLYPKNHPERWNLIDGTLGEGSPFHETYDYYAQGVDQTTATLPAGWRDRLVPIRNANTRGVTGWCLETHDLVASKLVAGRDKDLRFYHDARAAGFVDQRLLLERVDLLPLDIDARRRIRERAERN